MERSAAALPQTRLQRFLASSGRFKAIALNNVT